MREGQTDVSFPLQDNDLKQYLENCGNLMSVHNVKVRGAPGTPPLPLLLPGGVLGLGVSLQGRKGR